MNTNRFETFYDAVLAIVITILVLKISQPLRPEWTSFFSIYLDLVTYLLVFLSIINIWYSNQNLFQHIDNINNKALFAYGVSIFLFSLFPYFASWISRHPYSLAAETVFGLIILFANISHILAVVIVFGANNSKEKLKELNIKTTHFIIPIIITIIGFIISYTIFVPGIYVMCILAIISTIVYNRKQDNVINDTERFEALIDAIIAIIITVVVLGIPLAANGNLSSLMALGHEFIAYAISFVVCFNAWKFTYNLFSIVNKISYRGIWCISLALFFLSLIPYLTTFVSKNFHDFVPQCIYGIDFIIINILCIFATYEMKRIDESNVFLHAAFQNYNNSIAIIILTLIFIIIGYYFWPPIIILSCLLTIVISWIFSAKRINFPRMQE